MSDIRLRQLVFAAHDASGIDLVQEVLDLGSPFADPGVGDFGLINGVFALGDQFIEVVVPHREDTAAGRFLERSQGQGGYMAIFQSPDVHAVRQRADAANMRRVWNCDLPDIVASHIHPVDIGAAIVSIDTPTDPKSWRWGGPDWPQTSVPGTIDGCTIGARNPAEMSARWSGLLDVEPDHTNGINNMPLDHGQVDFVEAAHDHLKQFSLSIANPDRALATARRLQLPIENNIIQLLGVDIRLSEAGI